MRMACVPPESLNGNPISAEERREGFTEDVHQREWFSWEDMYAPIGRRLFLLMEDLVREGRARGQERMDPRISIVILTRDGEAHLGDLLGMIASQKTDHSFETIVIDSGSTDNTLAIARKFDTHIVEIRPEDFGHGKTRNLGARIARGDTSSILPRMPCPWMNSGWSTS